MQLVCECCCQTLAQDESAACAPAAAMCSVMCDMQDLEERLQLASHKAYEAETRAETASMALSTVRTR